MFRPQCPVNLVPPPQTPLPSLNSSSFAPDSLVTSVPSPPTSKYPFFLNNPSSASRTAPPLPFPRVYLRFPRLHFSFLPSASYSSSRSGPTRLLQGQRPQAADTLLVQIPLLSHPCPPAALLRSPDAARETARCAPGPALPRQAPPPSPPRLVRRSSFCGRYCPGYAPARPLQESGQWYGVRPDRGAKATKTAKEGCDVAKIRATDLET